MKSVRVTLMGLATLSLLVMLGLAAAPVEGAPPQQANLLANPSFEEGYYIADPMGDQRVPNNWHVWWNEGPGTTCVYKKVHVELESHPPNVYSGTWSARVWTGYEGHWGGIYQTVAATAGTRYRFTINVKLWSTANAQPGEPSTSQMMAQIGIDTAGGSNANASSVVWSGQSWTVDQYVSLSVEGTATGNSITVFTLSSPNWCVARNDAFWDNASLVVVSAGPAPTTPPPAGGGGSSGGGSSGGGSSGVPAGSIIPATPAADGSITHIVSAGETLIGIVVTYNAAYNLNLTVDQVKAQNGLTTNTIQPGQHIIIVPAGQGTAPTPTPTTASAEGTTPGATTEPTTEATEVAEAGGVGTICILGFEDANANSIRETTEARLAGLSFQVSDGVNTVASYTTDGLNEPYCFANLAAGNYIVSWTAEGFTPTNDQSWSVSLSPGTTVSREFGAQSGGGGNQTNGGSTSGPRNTGWPTWATALVGAVGVILFLSGVGVAGYFILIRRTQP